MTQQGPVVSQYAHDVVSTSARRFERCMDAETTSCAYRAMLQDTTSLT